ncbi:MAG: 4-hydroxythreonine-4-phosphate dehydrogenase PdxA [Acidiferrobacterales bacterium]
MSNSAIIAITTGEPAGIGPDLIVSLIQDKFHSGQPETQYVVITDPQIIQERAQELGVYVDLPVWQPKNKQPGIYYYPVKKSARVVPGSLDPANSPYVVETLRIAAQGCLDKTFQAMVTGPVHKGVINSAGISFTGHTEFLAQLSRINQPVMVLATEKLRVALVTTHLPLKEVASNITRARLLSVLQVLRHDLRQYFDIANPRIAVCGLNPHAGEDGHLGREEIEIIAPVLAELNQQGYNLTGPVSADTIFTEKSLLNFDVVLVMYHDQGLPVIKHAGFGKTVNITLGLPFIRTSVDHGTALELAGKNKIDNNSLRLAMTMAAQMARKK